MFCFEIKQNLLRVSVKGQPKELFFLAFREGSVLALIAAKFAVLQTVSIAFLASGNTQLSICPTEIHSSHTVIL